MRGKSKEPLCFNSFSHPRPHIKKAHSACLLRRYNQTLVSASQTWLSVAVQNSRLLTPSPMTELALQACFGLFVGESQILNQHF